MVRSACQYVEAYKFSRASKISGYDKVSFFGNFGHLLVLNDILFFVSVFEFQHYDFGADVSIYGSKTLSLKFGHHFFFRIGPPKSEIYQNP